MWESIWNVILKAAGCRKYLKCIPSFTFILYLYSVAAQLQLAWDCLICFKVESDVRVWLSEFFNNELKENEFRGWRLDSIYVMEGTCEKYFIYSAALVNRCTVFFFLLGFSFKMLVFRFMISKLFSTETYQVLSRRLLFDGTVRLAFRESKTS